MTKMNTPNTWRRTHLGAVIDGFEAGRNLRAHGRPASVSEYGVLKISAVSWGRFQPQENKALIAGDLPREREFVRNGDLLISRANTTELVGAVVRVDGDYHRLMLPDKILRLKVRTEIVDPSFLMYALRLPDARRHLEVNATGTSHSMRNLSQPKMEATPLLLPSVEEQRQIVTKLEALQLRSQRARTAVDAMPPLLEKLRQAVLAAAFRGDLTEGWRARHGTVENSSLHLERRRAARALGKPMHSSRTSDAVQTATGAERKRRGEKVKTESGAELPPVPETWSWVRVGDLIDKPSDIFDGPFGSALKTSDYSNDGVRVIRLENVANLEFRDDGKTFVSHEKYQTLVRHSVVAGDIIFGSFVDQATRVCILPDLGGPAIAKADCFCIRPDTEIIMVEALALVLGSQYARAQLTRGIHGSTRPRVNTGQLRDLLVPLPPLAEQTELIERVQGVLRTANNMARRGNGVAAYLTALEGSLLTNALGGALSLPATGRPLQEQP